MPSGGVLRDELEAVRKGRGVQEPDVRSRMGPTLRLLCGVGTSTPHSRARQALVAYLGGATEELPDELRLAANAMFAIDGSYRQRFLRQRYEVLARQWNCDFRTVQRRCDEAMTLIADQFDDRVVPAGPNASEVFDANAWYVERLNTVLLLDRPQPEAIEERTIVSTLDGLTRLGLAFGLPRHHAENRAVLDIDLDILYGAEVESVQRLTPTLFVQYLRLPQPLHHGQRHTYARSIRVPDGQLMVPRYVHLAVHRCDTFELRVKFVRKEPPELVWVLSKVPEFVYADQRPNHDVVAPDPLGEVLVRFADLQPGFGYGLAWRPAGRDHE